MESRNKTGGLTAIAQQSSFMDMNPHRAKLTLLAALSGIALAATTTGCELIASVDRELIAKPTTSASGTGGSGGQGAAAGSSGSQGTGGAGGQAGTGGTGGTGGQGGSGGGSGFAYPISLDVAISGAGVNLTWIKAAPSSGNTVSKIVRTLNTPPTGPNDPSATVVFTGSSEATTHALSDILPDQAMTPRTYHYAVYGCTPGMTCETMGSSDSIAPTVRQCLIGGGYNIFWRHASADVCSDDTTCGLAPSTTCPDWWKSCDSNCPPTGMAKARQLNPAGVLESQAIGQSFGAIGIPVGRVLSSEFCRCMKTAEHMSFGPTIEPNQDITYFVYDDADRCSASLSLLAQNPPASSNVALISHMAIPAETGFDCTTINSLAWAEAAIYKPDGSGGRIYITRLKWNEWDSLP
jgi:hypothetical protein